MMFVNIHKLHNRETQEVFLFQLCFWGAMLLLSLVLTRDSVLIRTCWSLSGIRRIYQVLFSKNYNNLLQNVAEQEYQVT